MLNCPSTFCLDQHESIWQLCHMLSNFLFPAFSLSKDRKTKRKLILLTCCEMFFSLMSPIHMTPWVLPYHLSLTQNDPCSSHLFCHQIVSSANCYSWFGAIQIRIGLLTGGGILTSCCLHAFISSFIPDFIPVCYIKLYNMAKLSPLPVTFLSPHCFHKPNPKELSQ